MSLTTGSSVTEVVAPHLRLLENQKEAINSIFDGVRDLLEDVSHPPTLKDANRLLLAFFLILDELGESDQMTVRHSVPGREMLRHCDAVYCALSYEHGSYDGDVGETWVPLRETLRTILIRVLTGRIGS
jgi:vacuolar-type H+-ATPase subunit E/Vma4